MRPLNDHETNSVSDMEATELERRKMISRVCEANAHLPNSELVKLCVQLGFSRATAHRVINSIKSGQDISRKVGSGKVAVNLTPKTKAEMKRRTAGKVAVSYRSLGKTFGLSPTTVKKYLDSQDIRC